MPARIMKIFLVQYPNKQEMSTEIENMSTIEKIKKELPVSQSSHTGLWGFERVMGCLNLNRCIYRTERSAILARAKWARDIVEYEQAAKGKI